MFTANIVKKQSFRHVGLVASFAFVITMILTLSHNVSADASGIGVKIPASRSNSMLKTVYSKALNGLVDKLQKDFRVGLVELTLDEVGHFTPNSKTYGVVGNGTFTTDGGKSWQPIEFEILVTSKGAKISLIEYQLPKDEAVDTAEIQTSEDLAAKSLLEQLKADYQTENIMIALDNVQNERNEKGQNIVGSGEMRIGGEDWKKFHFKLTVNQKQGERSNVKYEIE